MPPVFPVLLCFFVLMFMTKFKNFFIEKRRFIFALLLAGLFGGLFFFYLYGELLNPTYIDWILTTGGDPFQHYIGWEFFRHSPWTFPLGINLQYGYPIG